MASMNVDKPDVDTYLATAASSSPSVLHPFFEKFRSQYDRRLVLQGVDALEPALNSRHLPSLWHQLSLTLDDFYRHPESPPFHYDVFNNFIRDFEPKLNQLKLVELGVRASQQLDSTYPTPHESSNFGTDSPSIDPGETISFLVSLLGRISRADAPEAYVLLLAQLAHAKLILGDDEGAHVDIDESSNIIDTLDGVEPTVHAAFYGVAADYYKVAAVYAYVIPPSDGPFFPFRQKRITLNITRTLCSTWPASILSPTSHR